MKQRIEKIEAQTKTVEQNKIDLERAEQTNLELSNRNEKLKKEDQNQKNDITYELNTLKKLLEDTKEPKDAIIISQTKGN